MIDKMTNEEKLDHLLRLTDENNRILRSMNRRQILSSIFRLIYLALIIASVFGAYYFIKPLMASFTGVSGNSGSSSFMQQLEALKSQLPDTNILQEALNTPKE
jgi:hypothetical protein